MVRLKTRYLVVEVAAARPKLAAQREDLQGVIRESIARSHGDYGVGMLQYAFQGDRVLQRAHAAGGRAVRARALQARRVGARVRDGHAEPGGPHARRQSLRRTCREHVLALSVERADRLGLRAVYAQFPAELEAEIAGIDPQ